MSIITRKGYRNHDLSPYAYDRKYGNRQNLDKELLFARFASQSKQQESTGLGLAIVKSIVDLYSIRIDYQYANGMHTFTLLFY